MTLWRAWFRGLQHWERVRRPPTPAEEDAAFKDRIGAAQAKQERLQKALDELSDRQHTGPTADEEDSSA